MDKVKARFIGFYVALAALLMPSMAFAEGSTVSYSDFSSIITGITGQVSVTTIVGVLAQAVGISIGIVFMWWGVIRVKNIIMAAWQGRKQRL